MFFLFAAFFAASLASNYAQVKYGREMKNFFAVSVYSVVTCVIASAFFLFMTGFSPRFNRTILIFSLLFSVIVIGSQYLGVIVYKHMDILSVGLIVSSMTLVLTFLVGAIWYGEKITLIVVTRMLLSVSATVLLVLGSKTEKGTVKTRNTPLGYLICSVMILLGALTTVISKEFANLPKKQDENSYFLLVNIICLGFSLVVTVISQKGKLGYIFKELKSIGKTRYLYILASTLGSNLVSLLGIWILAGEVAVVLYAPLTASMGVMVQVLSARIIAKEKIPKIPVLLSLTSALLSFAN